MATSTQGRHSRPHKKVNGLALLVSILIIGVLVLGGFLLVRQAVNRAAPSSEASLPEASKVAARAVVSKGAIDSFIALATPPAPPRTNTGQKGLPILMYHQFYDPNQGESAPNNNFMAIADFEEQMKYLSENEYYYPSWEEVAGFAEGTVALPDKSVVVTDDDGDESFFRLAVPILKKYGVSVTSFLITSRTGKDVIAKYDLPLINYQSHSHDMHRGGSDGKGAFLTMTPEGAREDLRLTTEVLGSHEAFCYPFGHHSDFTRQMLAEAGFIAAVTVEGGRVKPGDDPLALPRVRMSGGDSLQGFVGRVQ